MNYYTGESIALQMGEWGCPCDFVRMSVAPQLLKYFFNLKNVLQLPKAKKLCEILGAKTRLTARFCKSNESDFAIELDRNERQLIPLSDFSTELEKAKPFSLCVGRDVNGSSVMPTLDDANHIMIGGCSGSGKSVLLNDIILSLCCYNKPSKLGVVLIDLKRCEFMPYSNLPHLITPIVTDSQQAENVLSALVYKMEKRYEKMAQLGLRKADETFKKVVIIIDELSDLVLTNEKTKDLLIRLAQKSRACNFHLILATQSVRSSVISGNLLANLPTRIALSCSNVRESVLILGHKGAENLTGKGDCILKLASSIDEKRVQNPFVSDAEIKNVLV